MVQTKSSVLIGIFPLPPGEQDAPDIQNCNNFSNVN